MNKAKSRKFNVRLLKSGTNFKDACKENANLKLISEDAIYSVYLATENYPRSPWWKNYLGIDDDVFNSNNSAILTVNTKDRIFVYTFGFAHTKLKQDCFEENFGFYVTINSIDGEKNKIY